MAIEASQPAQDLGEINDRLAADSATFDQLKVHL
jgi:hypothetical protein